MSAATTTASLLPRQYTTATKHSSSHSHSSSDTTTLTHSTTLLLAWEQSLGFFDDIPNDVWNRIYRSHALHTPHYRNAHEPSAGASTAVADWLYNNWIPTFSCPRLRRVGGLGDGSKWMCDPDRLPEIVRRRRQIRQIRHNSNKQEEEKKNTASWIIHNDNATCLIYSIGSNGNYQFEDGLIDLLGSPATCEIHIFDPGSYARRGLKHRNMYYHQWGLQSSYDQGSKNNPTGMNMKKIRRGMQFYTFAEIRRKLGHEHRTIDVFKIDCEGCEWTTYLDWIGEDIRQILIETHGVPLGYAIDFFDAFEQNGFVLYQRESNNYYGNSKCYEWSFLKMRSDFFNKTTLLDQEVAKLGFG